MTVSMDRATWSKNVPFLDRVCSIGQHLQSWKKVCTPPAKMTESKQFDAAAELCTTMKKELARVRKMCIGPAMNAAAVYVTVIESERSDYEKHLLAVRDAKYKAWEKATSTIPLIIKHKNVGPAFVAYLKTERSEENLTVYRMFMKGLTVKDMQTIWLKYIKTSDVNVPGALVKKMRKAAEEAERTDNVMEYAAIDWKKVRTEVSDNVGDTLIRFKAAYRTSFYPLV